MASPESTEPAMVHVAPLGWARVGWMAERKDIDKTLKAMVSGIRAAGGDELGARKRVKGVKPDPMQSMADMLETTGMRNIPVACEALICPKCLSHFFTLARFQTSSYG